MSPLQFEARHAADWSALEAEVRQFEAGRRKRGAVTGPDGYVFAARYRRVCEHLSLARARGYPMPLVDRLERVAADAHQLIYRQGGSVGLAPLWNLLRRDFPRCVYQHRHYVLVAAAMLFLPVFAAGWLVYFRPDLILSVFDPASVQEVEFMYSTDAEAIGRQRNASSDWAMFGYYISNNIGIAFRCFAGGLFFGVGSIFFLVYNGVVIGSVSGFLAERGLGGTFFPFVATHSSFELLAIVLSGAAGLRLGHALLASGRLTRRASLVQATRNVTPLIYGFTLLLLAAAAVEAFWSSSKWLPPVLKYAVGGACWIGLLAYLSLQGRHAR